MKIYGNVEMVVKKIEQITENVKRFYLYPTTNDKPLPAFTGGSHITTYVKDGDEVIERQYSLVSPPLERSHYSISIRRDDHSRGGSVFWHDRIQEGSHVTVSLPKNHFTLTYRAKHHVFYAAGIGITPFLTMMEDLERDGKTFELHYAARTKELCAYYDYLNEKYPGKCTFYFSRDEKPIRMTPDTMVNHQIGSHVYFCGPVKMVTEFKEAAKTFGYPEKSIHFELFAAVEGPRHPFVVELVQSKKVLEVTPDQTLLEALLQEGIDAPYSCKAGGCGQCELEVVAGEIDHRDIFFSDEERQERSIILSCCSRAKEGEEKLVLNV
jgi:ferredoxin-NADP reductase